MAPPNAVLCSQRTGGWTTHGAGIASNVVDKDVRCNIIGQPTQHLGEKGEAFSGIVTANHQQVARIGGKFVRWLWKCGWWSVVLSDQSVGNLVKRHGREMCSAHRRRRIRVADEGVGSSKPSHQLAQVSTTYARWALFTDLDGSARQVHAAREKVEKIVDVDDHRHGGVARNQVSLFLVADVNELNASFTMEPANGPLDPFWMSKPSRQQSSKARWTWAQIVFLDPCRRPSVKTTILKGGAEVMKGTAQA